MPSRAALSDYQQAFAGMLRGGDRRAVEQLLADPAAMNGLSVYRNNYVSAAVGALVKNYPAVERLVGADFFKAMARAYVDDHPPGDAAMTYYGDAFPDFLPTFQPAQKLSYLADVARLDRAHLGSVFAAEASALTAESLAHAAPEDIAALRPGLHPSARVEASDYPAYSIWRTNREDDEVAPIDATGGGETALFWRSGADVRHRAVSPGEAAFFTAVAQGAALGGAAEAAGAANEGFDTMATLAGALATGVLGVPGEARGDT